METASCVRRGVGGDGRDAVLRACVARTKEEQNERETGFEPMTYRAAIDCSTTELPAHASLPHTRATHQAHTHARTTFEQHHTQTSPRQPNTHATRRYTALGTTTVVLEVHYHTSVLLSRHKHRAGQRSS